jgi:hypothetical protein
VLSALAAYKGQLQAIEQLLEEGNEATIMEWLRKSQSDYQQYKSGHEGFSASV